MLHDDDTNSLLLQKKLNYFKDKNERIHISFKKGDIKRWKRGYILEISSDFFILWEDFLQQELVIFYLEVEFIEKYMPSREKEVKEE